MNPQLPHVGVPQWWTWVALVPLLAGGCNKPPNLLCRPVAFFQVLDPKQGAGAAPFSIERLGPEVKRNTLDMLPTAIVLKGNEHGRVDWEIRDLGIGTDFIFSPAEGLARNVNHPENVHPMKHFSDGMSEHVRFGFQSRICRSGEMRFGICEHFSDDELYLVADMNCDRH